MAQLQHESSQPVSLHALQLLLASCGASGKYSKMMTGEVLNAAAELYRAGKKDPIVAPAAFGMAVAVVSTNLEVSIRAAALILSTVLDLDPRGH